MVTLERALSLLSEKRPVFRSERDFQEALHNVLRGERLKTEKNKTINGIRVDLWIEQDGKEILIQLRHKTKKLSVEVNGEKYDLKNHGAQDISRYDFLKDVQSIERLCLENPHRMGYAILLTNDHLYWQKPVKSRSVDGDFLLFEGKCLSGVCDWKEEAGFGTINGREEPVYLKSVHKMKWKPYSIFPASNSEFRYLCVDVLEG
jgi:hypothetical protein